MNSKPLLEYIDQSKTLQIGESSKIAEKTCIDGIVFVGSTCSGKSLIIDALREAEPIKPFVHIPIRYITRPKRGKDNTVENIHLTDDEFQEMIVSGKMGLHWVRKMEGMRKERYGFDPVDTKKFAILSGNNAIYNNPRSVSPKGALRNILTLGVYAPDTIRKERLLRRSPDLFEERPNEVLYRLRDSSENMRPHLDLIVNNYGSLEKESVKEVKKLVEILAS